MKSYRVAVAIIAGAIVVSSCTSYKSREVSFKAPEAHANVCEMAGAKVGAEAYADRSVAKKAFGFDILEGGLLPVQVVIDNRGDESLLIVPEQTFLVDAKGEMWGILDNRTAYERLEESDEYAAMVRGGTKDAVIGAVGGALIGAAVGVVSGEDVGASGGKGAVLGGAGGAVLGGAEARTSGEAGARISRDLARKELENKPIAPGDLARGFIFFPGEARSARSLRLQLREADSGEVHTHTFDLSAGD